MGVKIVELRKGQRWAIMPEREYRQLLAKQEKEAGLPPLPKADAHGNVPAVAYARAAMAHNIIKSRLAVGLSQAALARKAGIRAETLNRIEKGKTTPDTATIAKISRALEASRDDAE